jgi:hypothetical protein
MLCVCPIDFVAGENMNTHTLRVYAYERINEDRSDIMENANDCSLYLRDIVVWWNKYGEDDIEVLADPRATFLSDRELDNLVGYYADLQFVIPSHGRCAIPIN